MIRNTVGLWKSRISDQVVKFVEKNWNVFGPSSALRDAWSDEALVNEKFALLEDMKGYQDDAFDELVSERQTVRMAS